MTLSQFIDVVRNRHKATDDSYWSDAELYALITNRCNEILSIIGLIEAIDTSTTTVASTQAYSIPTDTISLKQVDYDDEKLGQISLRQWEQDKNGGATPEGKPESYVLWNNQVYLIPVPNEAKTLKFYYEKEHPFIDGTSQTTIDIPSALHGRLSDGVISDMYAKDLNQSMAQYYQGIWERQDIPAFYEYARRHKRRDRIIHQVDPDVSLTADHGIV